MASQQGEEMESRIRSLEQQLMNAKNHIDILDTHAIYVCAVAQQNAVSVTTVVPATNPHERIRQLEQELEHAGLKARTEAARYSVLLAARQDGLDRLRHTQRNYELLLRKFKEEQVKYLGARSAIAELQDMLSLPKMTIEKLRRHMEDRREKAEAEPIDLSAWDTRTDELKRHLQDSQEKIVKVQKKATEQAREQAKEREESLLQQLDLENTTKQRRESENLALRNLNSEAKEKLTTLQAEFDALSKTATTATSRLNTAVEKNKTLVATLETSLARERAWRRRRRSLRRPTQRSSSISRRRRKDSNSVCTA